MIEVFAGNSRSCWSLRFVLSGNVEFNQMFCGLLMGLSRVFIDQNDFYERGE